MKILVFLHGTIIMHSAGLGKSREERVEQSSGGDPSVLDYANYVPIGNAVEKLKEWQKEWHEISYLSSHKTAADVDKDKLVLAKYDFPKGKVYWRENGQTYAEVAESIMPDVLIEDDVESDGGIPQTTYYAIDPEKKKLIRQILVREFKGIDEVNI